MHLNYLGTLSKAQNASLFPHPEFPSGRGIGVGSAAEADGLIFVELERQATFPILRSNFSSRRSLQRASGRSACRCSSSQWSPQWRRGPWPDGARPEALCYWPSPGCTCLERAGRWAQSPGGRPRRQQPAGSAGGPPPSARQDAPGAAEKKEIQHQGDLPTGGGRAYGCGCPQPAQPSGARPQAGFPHAAGPRKRHGQSGEFLQYPGALWQDRGRVWDPSVGGKGRALGLSISHPCCAGLNWLRLRFPDSEVERGMGSLVGVPRERPRGSQIVLLGRENGSPRTGESHVLQAQSGFWETRDDLSSSCKWIGSSSPRFSSFSSFPASRSGW